MPAKRLSEEERRQLREEFIKNKKRINYKKSKETREFKKALNKNRPSFNLAALVNTFDRISKRSSNRLVKLVMRGLAITNAAGYANDELQTTLQDRSIAVNIQDIASITTRMARLKLVQHIAKVYGLPKDITDAIINLQISKDFGQIPINSRPVTPVTRPIVQDTNYEKKPKIKRESPFLQKREKPKIKTTKGQPIEG